MAESGTCPSYTHAEHLRPDELHHLPPAEILIAEDVIPILAGLLDICGVLLENRWPAPFRPPIGEQYLEKIFSLTARLNQLSSKVYGQK